MVAPLYLILHPGHSPTAGCWKNRLNAVPERPHQAWVAGIAYIRLRQQFVYRAVIIDVFTGSIRGWHLGCSLHQELTLTPLRRALLDRLPEVHHSDQGIQYAATAYVDLLVDHGIAISMTDKGQAWKNGYGERLVGTTK